MKKYLALLVAVLLVVTGCGEKKLTCTMDDESGSEKMVYTFNKDNVATKVDATMTSKFDTELSKEEQESYKSLLDTMCALYDGDAYKCSVDVSAKEYSLTITMDINKMTAEEKEEAGYTEKEATYDYLKENLEESGYTCK